jgi:hypothetical protein
MRTLARMTRLATGIAKAYRQQMAKEEHARLLAQFAALDHHIGAPGVVRPRAGANISGRSRSQTDPLERLWRLPSRRHAAPPTGSGAHQQAER